MFVGSRTLGTDALDKILDQVIIGSEANREVNVEEPGTPIFRRRSLPHLVGVQLWLLT